MADEGPVRTPDEACQGEIILRTRRRRIIFMAGLAAAVIVALAAPLFA